MKKFYAVVLTSLLIIFFFPLKEASAKAPLNIWAQRDHASGVSYGNNFSLKGDVDGDGIKDFIISAMMWNSQTGHVYIYYGGSSLSASPDVVINGEGTNNRFGDGMAVGDFNGDGIDDLAAGAVRYSSYAGRAYVFHGRSRANWASINNASQANVKITGAANSHFGNKLAIGDIDDDGYGDLLVGAEQHADHGANLLYGKSDASITINWNAMDVNFINDFPYGLSSLGEDVEIADIGGDSHKDLLICAGDWLGEGGDHTGVISFFGSGTRLSGNVNASTAALQIWGHGDYFTTGYALKAGDVNGDGKSDIIAGVDKFGLDEYAHMVVFYGGPGLVGTKEVATDADVKIIGEDSGDLFGMAIATGDINHDGIDDIVVSAYFYTVMWAGPGRVYVFFGGTGLGSKTSASQADYIIDSPSGLGAIGWWLSAGDVNNDGWDEFCAATIRVTGTTTAYIYSLSHVPPTVNVNGPSINYNNNKAQAVFSGTAVDPDGGDIKSVQYSLNGGSWQNASPPDGSFNSSSEDYSINLTMVSNGTNSIRVRAADTENATTAEADYANATFLIIGILPECGNALVGYINSLII